MKTATVHDLEFDLSSVLHWIEEGEQVSLLRHGKTFAWMVPVPAQPPTPPSAAPIKMPDFLGQMREMFGDRVLSEEDSAAIREVMKGDR